MATLRPHLEFSPPATKGLLRSLVLALLAHGLLIAALTLGVQWKRELPPVTVEAELWSAVPQEAAPPAPVEPPLPPPPEPKPTPKPEPEPVVQPKPVPQPDPGIAIAKEKEKAKLLKEKQLREDKIESEKKRERLEKEKTLKEKAEKAEKDKAAKQVREAKDEKEQEDRRQQQIKRMTELAGSGGNGAATSTGTAAQSSAPTASYMGRIAARIKPNIVYTETIVGNPKTEIEVRMSPDGTILTSRVVKASGTKSWDEAALKAIDKTGMLPKDENGRVPSPLIIVMTPQELFGR
jgi:colicin import membrane protein